MSRDPMLPRLRAAFRRGWMDGRARGEEFSAREAGDRYPDYTARELDAFCQGSVDGAAGDTWRRDRMHARVTPRPPLRGVDTPVPGR